MSGRPPFFVTHDHVYANPGQEGHAVVTGDDDLVVLLNSDGTEGGFGAKLDAHRAPGTLHRAFSVFLFDTDGRVVLQRRSSAKAIFAGLWSNSCCSHPRPGEALDDAARRRTREELGLACIPEEVGLFDYHAHDPVSGLDERERVHVLAAMATGVPSPDPREVGDIALVGFQELPALVEAEPLRYSPWLAGTARTVRPWWERNFGADASWQAAGRFRC